MLKVGWSTDRFRMDSASARGVAYGLLGTLTDAEDAVQETWARLQAKRRPSVDIGANVTGKELTFNPDGTLTDAADVAVRTVAASPAAEARAITILDGLVRSMLDWLCIPNCSSPS